MDRETFLNLIPAYALGALDEDERAEFEAHLNADAEGRALLAEYQALANTLVLTAPVREAPAHLGADLRARVQARQSAEPAETPKASGPVWTRWLAVAAILALVFGIIWGATQLETGNLPQGQQLYDQLMATSGSLHVDVTPGEEFTSITGELVASPGSNKAVIRVEHLPSLPENQTYQLWLSGPDGVTSGGLFRAGSPDAPTYIVLPLDQPFEHYQGCGVSLEPAGGSPFPNKRSGPRVFNVRLGAA